MFISKKRHLAIIKEMRRYWSSEFDRMRRENVQLKAQLEAKVSFVKTVLPAPLPAVERPKYEIVHLMPMYAFKTLCGESLDELYARRSNEVKHVTTTKTPQQLALRMRQSWCADCLG